MGRVRACQVEDILDVARLDYEVSSNLEPSIDHSQTVLVDFYRSLIFDNPWFDSELPSLVWEDDAGRIQGFMGRLPRPMLFRERPIRTAVATKLMVHPSHRATFAAIELIRTFLAGPQDLSYSDGATSIVRSLWDAAGGDFSPIWSIKWARFLRPCLLAVSEHGGPHKPSKLARGMCVPVDAVATRFVPFRVPPPGTTGHSVSLGELSGLMQTTSSAFALRPVYEEATLGWLLDFIGSDPERRSVECVAVSDHRGAAVGWYVYSPRPSGVSEVFAAGTRTRSLGPVLAHLIHSAKGEGSAAVQGRLWPTFLDDYWDQRCFGKRGAWTVVHARDGQLLEAITTGNAFLSGLDGETALPLQRPPRVMR